MCGEHQGEIIKGVVPQPGKSGLILSIIVHFSTLRVGCMGLALDVHPNK